MLNFLKILTVFLACTVFFGKVGMPGAMILFEYDFIKVFLVTVSGGIFGNIFFTYLSAAILKWWHQRRIKKGNLHRQKIFTKTNKRIIKIKKQFGLTGIALLTPVLFSIPIGAFIAEKFYKDKRKIIIYLSASVVFWSLVIYLLIKVFHDTFAKWLI